VTDHFSIFSQSTFSSYRLIPFDRGRQHTFTARTSLAIAVVVVVLSYDLDLWPWPSIFIQIRSRWTGTPNI